MWYTYGKVSINKGSAILTGTGTTWADNKQGIGIGHMVILPGSGTVKMYQTKRVVSNTSIELTTAYDGNNIANGDYAIIDTVGETDPEMARRVAGALQFHQDAIPAIADLVTLKTGNVRVPMPDGSYKDVPALQSQLPFYDLPPIGSVAATYVKFATFQYPSSTDSRLVVMISGATDYGSSTNVSEIISLSARGIAAATVISAANVTQWAQHTTITRSQTSAPLIERTRLKFHLKNTGTNVECWMEMPSYVSQAKCIVLSQITTPVNRVIFHGDDNWQVKQSTAPTGMVRTPTFESFYTGDVYPETLKLADNSAIYCNALRRPGTFTPKDYADAGMAGLSMMQWDGNVTGYPTALGTAFNVIFSEHRALQLAAHKGDDARLFIRNGNSNATGWSGWAEVYSNARKPTPGDIGAYKKEEVYSRTEGDTRYAFGDPTHQTGDFFNLLHKESGIYTAGGGITGGLAGAWHGYFVSKHSATYSTLMDISGTGEVGWYVKNNGVLKQAGFFIQRPSDEQYGMTIWGQNTGSKVNLRRFRSQEAGVIWHETQEQGTYQLSTGVKAGDTVQMQIDGNKFFARAEFQTVSANGLRIRNGGQGVITRFDGSNYWLLFTAKGDEMGGYNTLRPLGINSSNGIVSMAHGLLVSGQLKLGGNDVYTTGRKPTPDDIGALPNTGAINANNAWMSMNTPKLAQWSQYIYVNTGYDGNQKDGGGTHIGQWDGAKFNHYFRGAGTFNVDCTMGMTVSKGWFNVHDSIHMTGTDSNTNWINSNAVSFPNHRYPAQAGADRNGTFRIWGAAARPTVLEWAFDTGYNGGSGVDTWGMFLERNRDTSKGACKFGVNGSLEAPGGVNNSSDIRLKSNIQKVSNPLALLNQISGYTFDMRFNLEAPEDATFKSAGVIAQEVQQILPSAVSETTLWEKNHLTVDYSQLSALYVEAIKELDKRVSAIDGNSSTDIELTGNGDSRTGVFMITEFGKLNKPIFDIPKGMNGENLIWVDFKLLNDTLMVKTYHRTYPSNPSFAQNVKDGYNEMDAIGIPDGHVLRVSKEAPLPTKETP